MKLLRCGIYVILIYTIFVLIALLSGKNHYVQNAHMPFDIIESELLFALLNGLSALIIFFALVYMAHSMEKLNKNAEPKDGSVTGIREDKTVQRPGRGRNVSTHRHGRYRKNLPAGRHR